MIDKILFLTENKKSSKIAINGLLFITPDSDVIFLYNDDEDISNFIHLNMKYWKLLFLCLVANSCDLDNDTNQPRIDKTELRAINKDIYKNFIYLDYLKDIANRLEYKISVDGEVNKTIIFFCDSSLQNIQTHGEEIKKVLEKITR